MNRSVAQKWFLVLVLVFLIHAFHLWKWGQWMWGRDHYQFFPMILAGGLWLAWGRLSVIRWLSEPFLSLRSAVLLLLSLLTFALAGFTGSHWIGLISCLLAIWTVICLSGGVAAADELRGPMIFLLLLVPLPLDLDLKVITGLQKLATWFASGGLDLAGIRHTVSGVAIRTAEKAYMVEEACSGIHSLFSAVAAMLFFGVYCRYGGPRLLLTAVQTVGWVIAANSVRVFLVVYADARFKIPLDVGWRHDALGFVVYAVVLLCALSGDQLLRFIFPISKEAMLSAGEELNEVLLKPTREFLARFLDQPLLKGRLAIILPLVLAVGGYVPFAGIAFARQWKSVAVAEAAQATVSVGSTLQLPQESLPEAVSGFTRVGFENVSRDPSDPFGMHSSIWQFKGHGMEVSVSVDGMYSEFHDLAYCYTGSGWKLLSGENGFLMMQQTAIPHTRMKLYRNAGEHALVYFSCFDSKRVPVDPPEASGSVLRILKNRLVAGGLMGTPKAPIVPPVFQIQLMVASGRELLPHEQTAIEGLFRDASALILTQLSAGQ